MKTQRLVVGITGSSGAILGIRLLEALRPTPIQTHLIISHSARLTIAHETSWALQDVLSLADAHYDPQDLSAPAASGSFATLGMVVIPCSIKSLSAIANSYSSELLTRAADVTLKEGRPLLLVVREAPLHAGHIHLMELAAVSGAILFPPVPAFYTRPSSVDEIVDNIIGRVLQRMGIENDLYMQWGEPPNIAQIAEPTFIKIESEEPSADNLWDLTAMTLATSGADGSPHAAAIYFAASDNHQELYFFSAHDSQHSLDLTVSPRAAATIQPQVEGWQEIRGLQLRGKVSAVPLGDEWEHAWARYLVKFPFASELREIVTRNTLYVFRPDWVRWIDNRRSFGHKEEWTQP